MWTLFILIPQMLWVALVGKDNAYRLQGLKWPWYRVLWWLLRGMPNLYVPRKAGNPMADFQSACDPEALTLRASLEDIRDSLMRLEKVVHAVMFTPTRVALTTELEVVKAKLDTLVATVGEGK